MSNLELQNKLHCGDAISLIPKIEDNSIDLLLTDPPYGVLGNTQDWDDIDIDKFTNNWWGLIKQKLKTNSSAYVFWSQKYIKLGFQIFNPDRMLIWHHPNLAKPTNKMFLWTYDPIFYIRFGSPSFHPRFSKKENVDVFTYAKPQSNFNIDFRFHPASKPLELIKNFVRISSDENNVVCDPFSGGGTSAFACKELKRNFICFELREDYCKIINDRLNKIPNKGVFEFGNS